uniref:Uncharacterized protein n=1 Tax=Anguilla anguilla TaxID=7936 RepID=A0A0E9S7R0_ANGAN
MWGSLGHASFSWQV